MVKKVSELQKGHGFKKKTPFQVQSLENFYSEEKYPTREMMEEYGASLDLTYKQIRIWFKERRRRLKRSKEARPSTKKHINDRGQLSSCRAVKSSQRIASDHIQLCQKEKMTKEAHCSTKKHIDDRSRVSSDRAFNFLQINTTTQNSLALDTIEVCQKNKRRALSSETAYCDYFQNLISKDVILKRVFRKDGPPLGIEFDPLPDSTFNIDKDLQSCQGDRGYYKRRKVKEIHCINPETPQRSDVPVKKYGIGKGFMMTWRAVTCNSPEIPTGVSFMDERATTRPHRSNVSPKETICEVSKNPKQLQLVPRQKKTQKQVKGKKKTPVAKRKAPCSKDKNQKKPHPIECGLSVDQLTSLDQSDALVIYVDDEELEIRDLQAAPNPLSCPVHLASNGRHGCSLCKDLLPRFPPQIVKMKQPFCTRPWESSPELVKKVFKVFRFLYGHATAIKLCPFTLDDFTQAFNDKESSLLGNIHVSLLKMLLLDVEKDVSVGYVPRVSKDCRFRGFLHFVREQEFDLNFWGQSLNPLTWPEILRQVMIAAGFGSKNNSARREFSSKETSHMAQYGLQPCTLKGELFRMLSEKGYNGLEVSEMAKASEIAALDSSNTSEKMEEVICSALSRDITLFEKIAPSSYRLRVDPHIKGKEDSQLDTEDSGSVSDESGDCSESSSSNESDGFEELHIAITKPPMIKHTARHKKKGDVLTNYNEIDESYTGEAWVLGLMEGEYSNLSINEKLDALVALVDLAGSGCSVRTEEPDRAIISSFPDKRNHGSGAKIKKSVANHHLSRGIWEGPAHGAEETCPTTNSFPEDTSEIASDSSKKGHFSTKIISVDPTEESAPDVHPQRSICLGSDRRYNSYWLFLGPCNPSDPGHRRVYFESSEDGHWEMIDTPQDLGALLSVLDCRGSRESRLFASLESRKVVLCQAMHDHMTAETGSRPGKGDPSDTDVSTVDSFSPASDIDNLVFTSESTSSTCPASGSTSLELGENGEEKKQRWNRLQAFDKWVWNNFYSSLNSVKSSERSFLESLVHCESCHDLYWRDEKHCKICHGTFEVDFDLEERYAIHVATCKEPEDHCQYPKHKVLPSQLQALKAAIHVIELSLPEMALDGAWKRSGRKLWIKRLRRTTSLQELLQVLNDFVGTINEDWLHECTLNVDSNMATDEVILHFQTIPQTTSAVALWMVKLDKLIAANLGTAACGRTLGIMPRLKRNGPRTT